VHPAAQALGHVVDDRRRPSHPGPPCALAQWRLGERPSTLLGFSTHAYDSRGEGERRATSATGGVAHWEWSDHTHTDQRASAVVYGPIGLTE